MKSCPYFSLYLLFYWCNFLRVLLIFSINYSLNTMKMFQFLSDLYICIYLLHLNSFLHKYFYYYVIQYIFCCYLFSHYKYGYVSSFSILDRDQHCKCLEMYCKLQIPCHCLSFVISLVKFTETKLRFQLLQDSKIKFYECKL